MSSLQKNTTPKSFFYLSPLFPVLAMVLIFLVSLVLAHSLRMREERQMRAETMRTAKYVEDELHRELHAYSTAVVRMAARWSVDGPPTKASWERDAQLYIRHFPAMTAVKWIDPSMRVKWFVPYVGNEQLMNLDLSAFKGVEKALRWTRERARPTVSESVKLMRGGTGFYFIAPLRVHGEFYGYMGSMVRAQKFFEESLANVAPYYDIKIEDVDESMLYDRNFTNESEKGHLVSERVFTFSRGTTWGVKVRPHEKLMSDSYSLLPLIVFVLGMFLGVLMAWALSNAQKAYRRARRIEHFNKKLNEEISERKMAQSALGESEKRFRELVENIREVFWVQDVEGKHLLYLSPACASIWGRSPEYYYSHPDAWIASIHPEDRGKVFGALEQSQSASTTTLEFRVISADGSVRWVRDRSVLMFEAGKAMRRIGISEDVTAKKKIEEKINELNKAFESALEGVSRVDTSGEIQMANAALSQMFVESFTHLRGLHWEKLFRGEDRLKLRKAYDQMLVSGKATAEVVGCKGDCYDNNFDAYIVLVKCTDQLNGFKGFYCFVSDVSEKKRRETVEVKSNFISMVSHELRTPLHAVREGIEIVLDESDNLTEDQHEMLNISKRNVARLSRMINDVLDFQKLEAGAVKLNLLTSPINELLLELKNTMQPLAQAKGIELDVELNEEIPELLFDADRITQVLMNLVSNAIKFTESGRVTLRSDWDAHAQQAILEVEDTGMGINAKDVPMIFKTFGQVGRGATKGEKGTGLGLAITRKIVEQHHGKISVESTQGLGSTFRVELPFYGHVRVTKSTAKAH